MYYQIGDITLEDFKIEDINQDYLSWLNDKEHMKYSRQSLIEHNKVSVVKYIDNLADTNNIFLSIKKNSTLIGTLTIYIDSDYQVCSPGILIGKGFAKFGYGGLVWRFAVGAISKDLRMRKVSAGAMINNYAMIKLFERSGMEIEATLDKAALFDGIPIDLVLYRYFT
jgi:RimJ/RimL family protein N-acetyltransferase